MRVAIVQNSYLSDFKTTRELLEKFFTLQGWAEAVAKQGFDIKVVVRFWKDEVVELNGVEYFFIRDGLSPNLKWFQVSKKLIRAIRATNPDLIHFHGMNFPFQLFSVRRAFLDVPLVVQNHAEGPRKIIRHLQKIALMHVNGIIFAAPGQEMEWIRSKTLSINSPFFFINEGSVDFKKRDRETARGKTGIRGKPSFLWMGNLTPNKDPILILRAFEKILLEYPEATLQMIYKEGKKETLLLKDVIKTIQGSEELKNSVRLLGFIFHQNLPDYYSSSDYLLLGSRKEGSGYAVFEGMACGTIPIVTNIPSFRVITDHGKIGGLWEPGNLEDLIQTVRETLKKPNTIESRKAEEFFEENLSWSAIGVKAATVYRRLIKED